MPKPRLLAAFVVVAALILAVVLNPSAQRHRDRIKDAMAERSPITSMLGGGALAAMTASYHSVGVASYTDFDGHIVSVGVLGLIFVVQ